MKRTVRFRHELVDGLRLTSGARETLCRELAAVDETLCRGPEGAPPEEVSRERRAFFDSRTDPDVYGHYLTTWTCRDGERLVAYFHAYIQVIEVAGQMVEVVRAAAGAHPEFRSQGLMGVAVRQITTDYSRHHFIPRFPRYYTGMCISPITYDMIGRRVRHLFPGPGGRGDEATRSVFRAIYGDESQTVVPSYWASLESPARHERIASSTSRYIRYFLDVNPRYSEAHALRFVVRGGLLDAAYGIGMSVALSMLRPIRRLRWSS